MHQMINTPTPPKGRSMFPACMRPEPPTTHQAAQTQLNNPTQGEPATTFTTQATATAAATAAKPTPCSITMLLFVNKHVVFPSTTCVFRRWDRFAFTGSSYHSEHRNIESPFSHRSLTCHVGSAATYYARQRLQMRLAYFFSERKPTNW
jgi:hypothetical protein